MIGIETLEAALSDAPRIALTAAFVWGVVSMLLSPCHLASIPLIVGLVDSQEGAMNGRRAFWVSLLFSLGLFIAIALIGLVTAILGRAVGDIGPYKFYLIAIIFFFVGLHMLGVISLRWTKPQASGLQGRGIFSALVMGTVFGVALGPCTFAFMAPLLAVAFNVSREHVGYGILLLVCYGVGHCSVIVVAGTCTGLVQRYLNWTRATQGAKVVRMVCGVLLLLAGLYMLAMA
jgi:cytochrome c-type biogenesis protein